MICFFLDAISCLIIPIFRCNNKVDWQVLSFYRVFLFMRRGCCDQVDSNFVYSTLPVYFGEKRKAVGHFYLRSMPGELKPRASKCVTCRGLRIPRSYNTSTLFCVDIVMCSLHLLIIDVS